MSSQTNPLVEIRRALAKQYCKSVLWLDDEINPAATGRQQQRYVDFFVRIADEFAKHSILCQLKGFPQIPAPDDFFSNGEPVISECIALAKQADILILDWHLGESNPVHSQAILNDLAGEIGNRFVVILSQDGGLDDQFGRAFGDQFVRQGDWYRHRNGLFVLLLQKSFFEAGGVGSNLVDRIYEQLAVSYPDYLHWAAIEVAARIKALAHSWLGKLPGNTDVAILAEKLHSTESVEEAILENLLDDLRETVKIAAVSSLSSDNLKPSLWLRAAELIAAVEADIQRMPTEGDRTHLRSLHPVTASNPLDRNNKKTLLKVMSHSSLSTVVELRQSIEAFGQFSEVVSVDAVNLSRLRPGSILVRDQDTSEIIICISQGCDCVRANSLLFLKGIEHSTGEGKAGETFVQFNGRRYLFGATAENLLRVAVDEARRGVAGYAQAGLLRQQALSRLISRFWTFSTRVGINQPRFVRNFRSEETL